MTASFDCKPLTAISRAPYLALWGFPRQLSVCCWIISLLWIGVCCLGWPAVSSGQSPAHQDAEHFFEKEIRPLLETYCLDCHHSDDPAGKLALDSRGGWQRGGEGGPAIVPHDPAGSLVFLAASYRDESLQMPPPDYGARLAPDELAKLAAWIRAGAYDPRGGEAPRPTVPQAATEHWAFQPLQEVPLPAGVHPIDALLERPLRSRGLRSAPSADSRTLTRRATFTLTGLPPTPEQLQTGRDDFPQLIDELLASPRYGETWGRHWLDVARYADAKDGVLMYGDARVRPFAYTYRDYVIRAFNEDKPFDDFIREQLAADQLDLAPDASELAALGLLTLGRMFDFNQHDVIDDQIDVVTRGFLGLTVACARCHDHKFDPIPTADYYSLYGVFASSIEPRRRPRIEPVAEAGEAFERVYNAHLEKIEDLRQEHYERTLATARQRTVDYLVRVATTEPDFAETAVYFKSLLPEELRPQMIYRWRQLIARRAHAADPIFGPWYDLLEGAGSQPEVWRKRGIDPRVVAALEATQPRSPREVAETYGRLLVEVALHRQQLEQELHALTVKRERFKSPSIDLADLVGGGDGTGTGQAGQGIHPTSGDPTTGQTGFVSPTRGQDFVAVGANRFVDGVFIPQQAPVVASSTGITIEGFRETSGKTWDYFKFGPSSGFTTTVIDGVDFHQPPQSLLALHANKGITFDLQALREEHGFTTAKLQTMLGNLGEAGQSQLDIRLYLDGKLVHEQQDLAAQAGGVAVDLELPAHSRFLTFVVTEGGQGISHDQAVLGSPRLIPQDDSAFVKRIQQRREALAEKMAQLEQELREASVPTSDPIGKLLLSRESPVWFPLYEIEQYLSRQERDQYRGLLNQLDLIAVGHPQAAGRAMVLRDVETPYEPVIFHRGDPAQPTAPVPRRFLEILSGPDRAPFTNGSGRLELAEAIASPKNPLTARVWVNRIWMHHFDQPLVENPSDFGLQTPEPLHRELLDYLASYLQQHDFRTKPLHRLIMTSRVWQRSSLPHSISSSSAAREAVSLSTTEWLQQHERDPENKTYWRGNRRRLELEPMRDAMLFVSGQLQEEMYGRPQAIDHPDNLRRTVYAFVERQNIPNMVQIFDFANADASTGQRPETTVPQQALFAMNSPFVRNCAAELAKRARQASEDPIQQIEHLFKLTYQRPPTDHEFQGTLAYLEQSELESLAQVLLMSNEFLFVD